METERMIYLVTEFAKGGEIFGKGLPHVFVIASLSEFWFIEMSENPMTFLTKMD